MNQNNFGKTLKAVIDTIGLTQSSLSQRTGVTEAAISQYISGEREPGYNSIIKILAVIPVTFEVLASKDIYQCKVDMLKNSL